MSAMLKNLLAMSAVAIATQAAAQVVFYERDNFEGRSFTTENRIPNLERFGFNDRASSVEVVAGRWEVCDEARFSGRCVVLRPGSYPSLAAMALNDRVTSVRSVGRNARIADHRYAPQPAPVAAWGDERHAPVTLYENEGFQGRSFTTEEQVDNLRQFGFNDRASSAVVQRDRWEVCDSAAFGGRCVVLRQGSYPSLAAMGLNDRISSLRAVSGNTRTDGDRYSPPPAAGADYRRRNHETLYEANVTSVRAVLGTPGQRCWLERQQVPQERSGVNVPGAVVGALVGGILGHQVGGGRGQDLATVAGAVGGAAVGANVGRGSTAPATTQDVQRCTDAPAQARADYWDVTYHFRGQEHRVQMTAPPGPTVTVNEHGEPRT